MVEGGVVEVDVVDTKTNRRHTHTLWPKDFVYCNERPGAHLARNRGDTGSSLDGYFAKGVYCGVPFLEAADAQADVIRRPVEGPKCCRFEPRECGHIVSLFNL